jgi:hypothetical protein
METNNSYQNMEQYTMKELLDIYKAKPQSVAEIPTEGDNGRRLTLVE